MISFYRQLVTRLLLVLVLCLNVQLLFSQSDTTVDYSKYLYDNTWQLDENMIEMNQDDILLKNLKQARMDHDTTAIMVNLIKLSYRWANQAKYNKSYDGYWETLLLAEKSNDIPALATAYQGLGWLYGFYGRTEKAKEYFRTALKLHQQMHKSNPPKTSEDIQPLLNIYFSQAIVSRLSGNYLEAKQYLDSCTYLREKYSIESEPGSYIESEYAYLKLKNGRINEALKKLLELESYFARYDPSYLVVMLPFVANCFESRGEYTKAEHHYLRSIELANQYSWHLDILPEIYADLAGLYIKMGQTTKAYEHLLTSKKQNEQMYGSRSELNSEVLEIKDTYRQIKDKQDQLIQKQKLNKLQQEAEISKLKTTLLYGTIISITVFAFLLYRHLRVRYKADKRFLQHQRAIELETKNKELEAKNKELTSSALHSIEREELLEDIRNELAELKKKSGGPEVGRLMNSIDHRISQSWEEFDTRFKSVHENFYERLKAKFTNLSANDHKLCALIKLNFSSKDMSRLLGISLESVHTNRYRLRKKMGLDRKDNLENFIANI